MRARAGLFESRDAQGPPAGSPSCPAGSRSCSCSMTSLELGGGVGCRDVGVALECRAGPRAAPRREVNFELQPWTFPGGPQRTSGRSRPEGPHPHPGRSEAGRGALGSAAGAGARRTPRSSPGKFASTLWEFPGRAPRRWRRGPAGSGVRRPGKMLLFRERLPGTLLYTGLP